MFLFQRCEKFRKIPRISSKCSCLCGFTYLVLWYFSQPLKRIVSPLFCVQIFFIFFYFFNLILIKMNRLKFETVVAGCDDVAVAFHGGAMEQRNHFKNGDSPKTQSSRANLFRKACFALFCAIVVSVAFTACNKDDDSSENGDLNDSKENGDLSDNKENGDLIVGGNVIINGNIFVSGNEIGDNDGYLSTITMTSVKSGTCTMGIAGTGLITIDWGDGTGKETHLLSSFGGSFSNDKHWYEHYFGASERTITISGINITAFSSGGLTSLDVSDCKTLTYLGCSGSLTNLDFTKNTSLAYLRCDNNKLENLNVSGLTALTWLYCNYNDLKSLDVSGSSALSRLECQDNQLSASALNALFNSLPEKSGSISISSNPGTSGCDSSIATNKNWRFN